MKGAHFLLLAAMLGSATAASGQYTYANEAVVQPMSSSTLQLPDEGPLPSLDGATLWLNSEPLKPASLRGKVVLIDFSTYTCINWLRTLPYVRSWAEKYKAQGLVVINVQTPEFEFEKNIDNVRWASKEMRVTYPTAVDNGYTIWNAFNNHYWPALYIVDAKGRIRHHQFGEGEYQQSERIIKQLLLDAGKTGVERELASVDARGPEVAADWGNLRSPESYVGYDRGENFASPGGTTRDKSRAYAIPPQLPLNNWALGGEWSVGKQGTVSNTPNGQLVYRFHARDVNLVMGPARRGSEVRFRVRIDGKPPGSARGVDVDAEGNGTVHEQRLYQLIRQPLPIIDHDIEIEFLDAGAELFVFTFG
jgi:thiol-disulfide isomerase/thioredoxin